MVVTLSQQHNVFFVFFPFILDVRLVDVSAGVTQEEGHTGIIIHLNFFREKDSAVLSLVDREVEFCVLTI